MEERPKIQWLFQTVRKCHIVLKVCLATPFAGVGFSAYSQAVQPQDSITVAIAPEYNQVGEAHRFWLGSNYRELWATPVKMRVLDLRKERGGLKIVKLGGGMQTRSLRFADPTGREWVLRTIQKYPEKGLPENLRATVAKDILQDQVSTGHPFAALVVPPLAQALSLPHVVPEIVYIGDDPGLEEYRNEFANAAYLFEPRQPFESEKTDNTLKVQRKVEEDNDTKVDQAVTLRARLLDFLLGDWDRHEDNWRWAPEKENSDVTYTPVPRDRDKVFYKTSGVFPWILSHQWLKSNIQPYGETIRDVNGWNFNARYFDRYFLNRLSWSDWEEEIQRVQRLITDDLIDRALQKMPDTIYAVNGKSLAPVIKERRNNLRPLALEYFSFLSKVVDIPASAKREFIDIKVLEDGSVNVVLENKKKDGSRGRKLYERSFNPGITQEIRIYGIAGEDEYQSEGISKSPIKIRLIGGKDPDNYSVSNNFPNSKRLLIYDTPDTSNSFPQKGLAKLKFSADSSVHAFDKKSFKYDRLGPVFLLNYSIDRGFLLSAGILQEKQGFRKEPYAVKHDFLASYSTGRQSWFFKYKGDFKELIGKNDLVIDINSWGPKNLGNFFGNGNNSVFENKGRKDMSYYRNRYDYLLGEVKLKRQISKKWTGELGLGTEYYTSKEEHNRERFFNDYDQQFPGEEIFNNRFFGGVSGGLYFDTRTNPSNPIKGMYWKTLFTAKSQFNNESRSYGKIHSEFNFYLSNRDSSVILANRIGGGTTIGDPLFFQQMQLGGEQNLRGYHSSRFRGHTMLYHNLELRMKLFSFRSYLLPGTIGLIGFNDIGRVWLPGEKSSKWHDGYGTGFYISPADLILIQAVAGFSKEGNLPYISMGFSF